jgi:hypothetical protein
MMTKQYKDQITGKSAYELRDMNTSMGFGELYRSVNTDLEQLRARGHKASDVVYVFNDFRRNNCVVAGSLGTGHTLDAATNVLQTVRQLAV